MVRRPSKSCRAAATLAALIRAGLRASCGCKASAAVSKPCRTSASRPLKKSLVSGVGL
jgi:hypothetical protein